MAPIIGRKEELKKLEAIFNSSKAEFMAVYGRRRIGKTFLIQNFFSQKDCVFFHVTGLKDGSLQQQIENFTRAMGKTFFKGVELKVKNNWLDTFDQLTEILSKTPKNKKIVLFFDELPWLSTKKSKLIQAIDHFWNRYWSSQLKLKLVVCGSSASWILEKLIHAKGGLYNRITSQLKLEPFTLAESREFLHAHKIKLSDAQIAKLYMATGGIPLYLEQVQQGLSADQNIDEICFTKQGLLYSEFGKLFASLFEQHEVSEELVRIIADNRYGISQQALMKKSSKGVGGRLKTRLKELEDAGFIESFMPYQHKEKGIFYKIIDEYTLFYLKWIEPVFHSVKQRNKEKGYWLSKQKSSAWESWSGYAFEALCYKHIEQIRKALNIGPGAEIGVWRYSPRKKSQESGAQIDLLFDRDDGSITICEIKHTISPFVIDKKTLNNIQNKIKVFTEQTRIRKQIFVALISANGMKSSTNSDKIITNLVTLEDLFKE